MIEIKVLKQEDILESSTILAEAFAAKFKRFVSLSQSELSQLLAEPWIFDGWKDTVDYAAYEGKMLLGIMRLHCQWVKHGKQKASKVSWGQLMNKYGMKNVLWLFIASYILWSRTKKTDCYIEHIAVWSNARGKGIGTQLLDFWEDIAKKYRKEFYTLYVAGDNRAKDLYEKMWFETISEDTSLITKFLFGHDTFVYMKKPITSLIKKSQTSKFHPHWYLGCIGFVFFFKIHVILAYFEGSWSILSLLHFLWLLWFLYFLPQQ